jgi:hypothetical protein
MRKKQVCPQCGRELKIVFRPSTSLFKKIGLDNAMFCSNCKARLSLHIKPSYLAVIFYLPYLAVLTWNIFVAQYGMKNYGFEKLDYLWIILSLAILAVGIVVQSQNKVYVLHKHQF